MATIKERLIQVVLRGKDMLSGEAARSAAALDALRQKGEALQAAPDSRGLQTSLREAEHASRVGAAREAMSGGMRTVLVYAAAYVGLDAALGLASRGVELLRGGIGKMRQTGDRFEALQARMTLLMGSVQIAGGNQEIVTLAIQLFPVGGSAPGLIEPAHLCEVRDIGGTWRGLCLATEIAAEGVGASRVTQTLKLERHH